MQVTINYRLSTLGYLALSDGVTNGNFGIADQIVALDWVRANIAAFGGDADRITISGQSAGAVSTRVLMASEKSRGKFAAALSMSNPSGFNWVQMFANWNTLQQSLDLFTTPILNATGCSGLSNAQALECLRAYDAEKLVNLPVVAQYAHPASANKSLIMHLSCRAPIVDGNIIKSRFPSDGSAPLARVPMMMGILRDDAAAFTPYPTNANLTEQLPNVMYVSTLSRTFDCRLRSPQPDDPARPGHRLGTLPHTPWI